MSARRREFEPEPVENTGPQEAGRGQPRLGITYACHRCGVIYDIVGCLVHATCNDRASERRKGSSE